LLVYAVGFAPEDRRQVDSSFRSISKRLRLNAANATALLRP
jgi:hypothetical protein